MNEDGKQEAFEVLYRCGHCGWEGALDDHHDCPAVKARAWLRGDDILHESRGSRMLSYVLIGCLVLIATAILGGMTWMLTK